MVMALNLGQLMSFFGIFGFMFLGIFVIALLTPKLAAWIDKQRAKNKSPYEDLAPEPERVQEESLNETENSDNSDKKEQL